MSARRRCPDLSTTTAHFGGRKPTIPTGSPPFVIAAIARTLVIAFSFVPHARSLRFLRLDSAFSYLEGGAVATLDGVIAGITHEPILMAATEPAHPSLGRAANRAPTVSLPQRRIDVGFGRDYGGHSLSSPGRNRPNRSRCRSLPVHGRLLRFCSL